MNKIYIIFLLFLFFSFSNVVISGGNDANINIVLYQTNINEFSPNADGINDEIIFSLHAIVSVDEVHGNAPIHWKIKIKSNDGNDTFQLLGQIPMDKSGRTEFTLLIPWNGCINNNSNNCRVASDGEYTHTLTIKYKDNSESASGSFKVDTSSPDFIILSPANSTITYKPSININGKCSSDISQIIINDSIVYCSLNSFQANVGLSEGENNFTIRAIAASGKYKVKYLKIIKKGLFHAYIAEFNESLPLLESYDGLAGEQDISPEVSYDDATYNQAVGSLKISSNTWKKYNFARSGLRAIELNDTSELIFAIRIDSIAEMIGIGIGDGQNELIYSISGTEIQQYAFVNQQYVNSVVADHIWHFIHLPVGKDWKALYGSYATIDRIFFIHDNDAYISQTVYFDDVALIDSIAPPPVSGLQSQESIASQEAPSSNFIIWQPSPAPDIDHYDIYRKKSSEQEFPLAPIATTQLNYYFDNSFAAAEFTSYDYVIVACDTSGNCNCNPNENCDENSFAKNLKPHIQFEFSQHLNGNLAIYTTKEAFGDVNGDGFTDAVLLAQKDNNSYELRLSINNAGVLSQPIPLRETGSCIGEPVVRDLDGDGFLDIIYCYQDSLSDGWRLLKGNGDGSFSDAASFIGSYYSAEIADMDRDGDLDIILGTLSGSIVIFYNNSYIDQQNNSHWQFQSKLIYRKANLDIISIAVTDVNNDSYNDIILASAYLNDQGNYVPNNIVLISNKGMFSQTALNWDDSLIISSFEVADFDNDGDIDIIADSWTTTLNIYFNDGDGNFNKTDAVIYSKVAISPELRLASGDTADIDNDGDIDLVLPGYWVNCENEFNCFLIVGPGFVFRNLGNGSFAYFNESLGPDFIGGSVLIDLDNDSDTEALLNFTETTYPLAKSQLLQQSYVLVFSNREADAGDESHPYGSNPNEPPSSPEPSRILLKLLSDYIRISYNFNDSQPDLKTTNADLYCNLYIGTHLGDPPALDDVHQAELLSTHNSVNIGQFPCGASDIEISRNILNKAGDVSMLYYSIQFVDQNMRRSAWSSPELIINLSPGELLQPPINVSATLIDNGIEVRWEAPASGPSPSAYFVYWGSSSKNYYSKSNATNDPCSNDASKFCYIISAGDIKNSCSIFISVTSILDDPTTPTFPDSESELSQEASIQDFKLPSECIIKSGYINSETWGPNKCYYIIDYLTVNANNTLTINEGSCIYVKEGKRITLNSNANIIINGSSNNTVIIKSDNENEAWGGLFLNNSKSSHINYAEIYNIGKVNAINNSSLTINNSLIKNIAPSGYLGNNLIYIENNAIFTLNDSLIQYKRCSSGAYYYIIENKSNLSINNSALVIVEGEQSDSCNYNTTRAISNRTNAQLHHQEYSNIIYKIRNGSLEEEGVYFNSDGSYFSSSLNLKPLGYTCPNANQNQNCNTIPYFIQDSLILKSDTQPYPFFILNNARLVFAAGSLNIGDHENDNFKAGFISYNNSSITGKVSITINKSAIPYDPQNQSGSMIIDSTIIDDDASPALSLFSDILIKNNLIKFKLSASNNPTIKIARKEPIASPTIYLENNNIIDTEFLSTSPSYIIAIYNGLLKMENNKIYHILTNDDNNARGIEWYDGNIISDFKKNSIYKKICNQNDCIIEKDGIYHTYDKIYFNKDLNLKIIGYACENIENCSNYIPYYITKNLTIGRIINPAYFTIEAGLEVYFNSVSVQLGYYPYPEHGDNYYAAMQSIGTDENHIILHLDNSIIKFHWKSIGYNKQNNTGSVFKYTDIISSRPISKIIHEGKYNILFDNCYFANLQTIEFNYEAYTEGILPKYFLPQATFTHCNFDNFIKTDTSGFITAGHNSHIIIDYCKFENNINGAKIIYANYNSKIKIHHSNLPASNSDKIYIANDDAVVDARWNYWGETFPSYKNSYDNNNLKVSPFYLNPLLNENVFHIIESHVDINYLDPDFVDDINTINISFKPNNYPVNWNIKTNCDNNIKNITSGSLDNGFQIVSLKSDDFICSNQICNCLINIIMHPQNNPNQISQMDAKISLLRSIDMKNQLLFPIQSSKVPDIMNISGYTSSGYEIYYSELPFIKDATIIASGNSGDINIYNQNISEFPDGEGYLIIKSLNQNGEEINRFRHIIIGSSRPIISLSKQIISPITNSDSVTINIFSYESGNALLKICNNDPSINVCYQSEHEIQANKLISINWDGKSGLNGTGAYVPDGIYRVYVEINTESGKYIYYPTYRDSMDYDYIDRYYSDLDCLPVSLISNAKFYLFVRQPLIANLGLYDYPYRPVLYKNVPFVPNISQPYIIPHSNRYIDPNVFSCKGNYLDMPYLETGMFENAIIAYGSAAKINYVYIPYYYFKPTVSKPWHLGLSFYIELIAENYQSKGVKIFIKECGLNKPALITINKVCDSSNCVVQWNGKDASGNFLPKGCYKAEIYASDNREFPFESLSPYPFPLQFFIFY